MYSRIKNKIRYLVSDKPMLFFPLYRLLKPRLFEDGRIVSEKSEIVLVMEVHEQVVLADFNQVINNYAEVIRRVNEKFSTEFKIFDNSSENLAAVFQRINKINYSINEGKQTHLAIPVTLRKNDYHIDLNEPSLQEALNLYEKLINILKKL